VNTHSTPKLLHWELCDPIRWATCPHARASFSFWPFEGGKCAAFRSLSIFSALWEMAGETIRFAYELEHKTESQPKQSGKPKGI